MKLTIELDGKSRTVEVERSGKDLRFAIDGSPVDGDVAEIHSGAYSVLIGGRSLEVRIDPKTDHLLVSVAGREFTAAIRDPREWKRKHGGAVASQGRQQIVAPMPGKVVRILAKAGEAIEAGQGILVVEAMKMQNEVKAPKSGQVEKIAVAEGQSVNAGDVLAVVG